MLNSLYASYQAITVRAEHSCMQILLAKAVQIKYLELCRLDKNDAWAGAWWFDWPFWLLVGWFFVALTCSIAGSSDLILNLSPVIQLPNSQTRSRHKIRRDRAMTQQKGQDRTQNIHSHKVNKIISALECPTCTFSQVFSFNHVILFFAFGFKQWT